MIGRFGSREICDVTFKSLVTQTIGSKEFVAGQPVFIIDTATTSNMEQATTTVYAQGGRGYNRLIAWEGEKTMTFTVTDALMSPIGLKVLSGAGFAKDSDPKHIHVTFDVQATAGEKDGSSGAQSATAKVNHDALAAELGIPTSQVIYICNDEKVKSYATILDSYGAVVDWAGAATWGITDASGDGSLVFPSGDVAVTIDIKDTVESYAKGATFTTKLDFYVVMESGASEITIAPEDFGGNFYVEADTLYRNQAGKDMAATLTFPNVKIQSGFSIAMAANGDPSTFDFVMDAFPGYTYFDNTKKVICDITLVSGDTSSEKNVAHKQPASHGDVTSKEKTEKTVTTS